MTSRPSRGRVPAALASLAACLLLPVPLAASDGDEGIALLIDRESFELVSRDERSGEEGPRMRVAVGSPARPTPLGEFRMRVVVLKPAWTPASTASAEDAVPQSASCRGPMGIAKVPFAEGGLVALHGGAKSLVLGKPVSAGCVRIRDVDMIRLIGWLVRLDALDLESAQSSPEGEIVVEVTRPVRVRVH